MKKSLIVTGVLAATAVLFSACAPAGVPQADYDALKAQLDAANAKVTELEAAASSATDTGGSTAAGSGATLAAVKARGSLKCGGNANLPGFGFQQSDGTFSGFDVDYCRVIATAALGDATKFEVTALSGTDRFPALQAGEVDVLIRNTTWTVSRDTQLGFNFGPTTFYDGQGMMVRADSGITDLEGLRGKSVCVQQGTTTEKNLADVMRGLDIEFEQITFPDADPTRDAYDQGRCDGFTTDKSGLIATRTQLTKPEDHIILEVTMSKEPLGPLVRHGDDQWKDTMDWAVYCTFAAEEYGISSANVDDMMKSDDPVIRSLLGVEGDLGSQMGLSNDFCYQIVKQVGNYEEIYNRNLGPDTPYNVPRGVNSLWTAGGLLYAPPYR
ncbi:MAG TPA: amino acid ABC transporter substrate-binding protein [Anaerolineales bacterium]|nr:amino acid ABC transporter substrate-binding protein [Anaerolineales bacterium]